MQGPSSYHLTMNIDTLTSNFSFLYQKWYVKMTINTQMFIKPMFILISLQVFSDGMGTSEKWQKTIWLGLWSSSIHSNPPDRVFTQAMVESQIHAEVVYLSMHGKRAHLFLYAPNSQLWAHIECQKCYTVVGLTTAPGTLGVTCHLTWPG